MFFHNLETARMRTKHSTLDAELRAALVVEVRPMPKKATVHIGGRQVAVPDEVRGKWKWTIGHVVNVAGLFNAFEIKEESGHWYSRTKPAGTFFNTQAQARKAGAKRLAELKK